VVDTRLLSAGRSFGIVKILGTFSSDMIVGQLQHGIFVRGTRR
jgi:hypothetical protein